MPPTRRRLPSAVFQSPPKSSPPGREGLTPTTRSDQPEAFAPPGGLTTLNLETLAWLAVALVSVGARLISLDGNPLQPSETSLAMNSWRIFHGGDVMVGPSPLLTYANVVIFLTLGATDASARVLSAVCGVLVALSPWLLREHLGKLASLAAALILATSPTLIFAARSIDSTSLTLALALGILAALLRFFSTGRATYAYGTALLLPPLLVSGPAAVTLVIVAVGYLIASGRIGMPKRKASEGTRTIDNPGGESRPWAELPEDNQLSATRLRSLGLIVVVEYAILATALGTNLPGFGDSLAQPLTVWAGSLSRGGLQSAALFPLVLLGYEPAAFVFGLVGAVLAFRRLRVFDQFLIWWAVIATAVVVIGDGLNPVWYGVVLVPLALLAGRAVEDLWAAFADADQRRRLLMYLAVTLPLLATTIIAAGNATLPDPNVPRWAAAAPMLAIVIFSIGFGAYYRYQAVLTSFAALTLCATLGLTIHAAMLLNPGGPLNPSEVFAGSATSPDVRTMANDITTVLAELRIARQLEGKPVTETVEVAAAFADPIAWYLRDFPQTRIVNSVGDSPAIAVVGTQSRAPSGSYAGEAFQLLTSASRPAPSVLELGRWWLYRQSVGSGDTYVKVFVKTQLGRN